MHSQIVYCWLLCILYYSAAVPRMHVRSGEAGDPEEPQSQFHMPGQGWKQGKTTRFLVPGFRVTSSLVCHSHLRTVWCSNSRCKKISSGRTSLLRVTLLILAADRGWTGSTSHGGQRAARDAGRRQNQVLGTTRTQHCQQPLQPSSTKMVQPATWGSGKCFSFFLI